MNIIGIDVSKDILVGARINCSGRQVESYQIGNNKTETSEFFVDMNLSNTIAIKKPSINSINTAAIENFKLTIKEFLKRVSKKSSL